MEIIKNNIEGFFALIILVQGKIKDSDHFI